LRAVHLVANSELAICSRTSEAGGLAFATVLGLLVDTWITGNGGSAEFAIRSTARKGAHHHSEEIGRQRSTTGAALALFPQQINRARGAHHHGEEI